MESSDCYYNYDRCGKICETLEKQLELLSERSQSEALDPTELAEISDAMVSISRFLLSL